MTTTFCEIYKMQTLTLKKCGLDFRRTENSACEAFNLSFFLNNCYTGHKTFIKNKGVFSCN
jgi:hypothetical protein